MEEKLALVVDDSKSACFVLMRMLKEFNLEVDTAESAADAIDYLKYHRPDVIFMDHMMPGMDGFEAVKRIKNDPRTAVIPIMMYTSKGGDVYLSKARALGAVGIIPKTISPVDLKETLLNLKLIDDLPIKSTIKVSESRADNTTKEEPQDKVTKKRNVLDIYADDLRRLMDDQTVELHKSMWLGIESVSNEIFNKLNSELEEQFDRIQPPTQEAPPELAKKNTKGVSWPIYIISVLLVFSIIVNVSLFSKTQKLEGKLVAAIETQSISAFSTEEAEVESLLNRQNNKMVFINWAQDKVIQYPFNELGLNENRFADFDELTRRALEAEFTGDIILQTHAGMFCLTSDHSGDYKLADNDLPVTNCDFIGNYVQPIDEPTTHQSLSFANYLSDMGFLNDRGIMIEVTNLPRSQELSEYPEQTSQTTAEEWNIAAQLNNLITVKLKPR